MEMSREYNMALKEFRLCRLDLMLATREKTFLFNKLLK